MVSRRTAMLVLGACAAFFGCQPPPPKAPSAQAAAAPAPPWEVAPEVPQVHSTPWVALTGATVLTGTGAEIADGVVLLKDGLLSAVGPRDSVTIPPEAEQVSLPGRFLTPGIIDTHSHMGVYAQPAARANRDSNEATHPVTAEVRAIDSFWPQDPALPVALSRGVTTIQILPGSANLVGGEGAILQLAPGRGARDYLLPGAPRTLKMACGENPKRVYEKSGPSTRMGNLAYLRGEFQKAVEYARDYEAYQARYREWSDKARASGKAEASPAPQPPSRDRGLETLLLATRGEVLVQVHCYRADDMLAMLALADEFGFSIRAFHHAVEAYKIRDVLAERGIGVATWVDWWGFKLEAYDAIQENVALLAAAGVKVAVHSDSPELVQRLNQEAAKAVGAAQRAGLEVSTSEALTWVTQNAAWVLGVDDQLGTLEPGKKADLVVWSANPLSVYAHVEQVYLSATVVYDARRGRRPSDFDLGQGVELGEGREPWSPSVASPNPGSAGGER